MAGTRLDSLPDIDTAVWRALAAAAAERGHPWRTPVLATVDGDAADARTVVLREVDSAARQLVLYSDARAGKLAQIAAHPVGTLVHWSAALGWQLRLRVRLEVHVEGLAATSRWARIRHTAAAQDYLAPLPPGAALDAAPAAHPAAQREHFAAVVATVVQTDWLELHRDGHRRAVFDAAGARWVQP